MSGQVFETADFIAAGLFGFVQGLIGQMDEFPLVFGAGGEIADADRQGDGDGLGTFAALQILTTIEADALGDLAGMDQIAVGEHDREFFAAVAAGDVLVRVAVVLQKTRDLLQDFVAFLMPEGVVEFLEKVDVDQQHGQRFLGACCMIQLYLQAFLK